VREADCAAELAQARTVLVGELDGCEQVLLSPLAAAEGAFDPAAVTGAEHFRFRSPPLPSILPHASCLSG
jgi:hypothetical protein